MKLIVGLGNPGSQYKITRHNAGVMLVEKLSTIPAVLSDYGWRNHKEASVYESKLMFLAKPVGRFMNESGVWVREIYKSKNDLELFVAHDDLDLKLGEYKIQKAVGPKIHNGVNSVEQSLGTKDFWRIRIGVDNRDPQNRTAGEEYVLQPFTTEELQTLNSTLQTICEAVLLQ